jgi:adenosylmethionine-8-amino-7-oxononanoate aminotransferase
VLQRLGGLVLANETAIKMAKQYFWQKEKAKRWKIIARRYSYCGTTLGGSSATGIPWFREYFEPLMPGFLFTMSAQCFHCELRLDPSSCELACLREMEKIIQWENPETVAAVIIDPIPGSNTGYPLPPAGYLEGLRALCDEYGILLIFDEIQTGFGKTGKWFACEHWGITPDIMTLGKGLTGGYLPLGAAVTTPKVYEVFRASGAEFRSGSTYGGHTTACATTLTNIEIIEREHLVEKAAQMGVYLKERLEDLYRKHPIVGDIRGIGMLWAVELLADRETRKSFDTKLGIGSWIRDYCWQKGMILRNNGDILVIAPALIMKRDEAEYMLGLIDEAISAAETYFKFT